MRDLDESDETAPTPIPGPFARRRVIVHRSKHIHTGDLPDPIGGDFRTSWPKIVRIAFPLMGLVIAGLTFILANVVATKTDLAKAQTELLAKKEADREAAALMRVKLETLEETVREQNRQREAQERAIQVLDENVRKLVREAGMRPVPRAKEGEP